MSDDHEPIEHFWADDDLPPIPEPDPEYVVKVRLGALLRDMRHEAGLSSYAVESHPDAPHRHRFPQSSISDWENNHHVPTDANLQRLIEIYVSHISGANPEQMYRLALAAKQNAPAGSYVYPWSVTRLADRLAGLPTNKMNRAVLFLEAVLSEFLKYVK